MFLATLLTVAVLGNPEQTGPLAVSAPPKATAQKSKSATQKSKSVTKNQSSTRRSGGSAAKLKSPRGKGKSTQSARKSKKSSASSRPARKPRLPRHFSQLDLEDAQRQEVLKLQSRFADRIAALRRQIAQAQTERDKQLDALLKPAQKRRLKQLRDGKNARQK